MEAIITLTGNVGTEVESYSGEGWTISRFRMASTPRFRRGDEWVDGETTWVSVRARGRLAEHLASSVHKGDPVVVHGKLRTHSFVLPDEGKQDRLVVEATAVGHDLSRGTSQFRRAERIGLNERHDGPILAGEPDLDDDSSEVDFDPATGEVLREPVTTG